MQALRKHFAVGITTILSKIKFVRTAVLEFTSIML